MKTLYFKHVKTHPKAITPNKTPGNLGFDLSVVRDSGDDNKKLPILNQQPFELNNDGDWQFILPPKHRRIFHTGLKIAIQAGYGVVFWDRSGLSIIQGLTKLGGCIDSTYRGEWMVCLYNLSDQDYVIVEGDRIIQCIVLEEYNVTFVEDKQLDETVRGEKGFGASGR